MAALDDVVMLAGALSLTSNNATKGKIKPWISDFFASR